MAAVVDTIDLAKRATTPVSPPSDGRARPRSLAHPAVRSAAHLRYLPGLDGLRALAVLAVLLYHAEMAGWWVGGFMGVEVFFVISGYLITSILLTERTATHHNDLKTFYVRRARRLLPALLAVLAATTVVAVIFLPEEVATLRGDVVSALTYVTNWFFIFGDKSYFEFAGRPSLVQHLWSLAVEEQFYLIWPLLFVGGMKLLGRTKLFVAVLVGAVASTLLMAALYQPGVDASRVYYGTDTRAGGLLFGAALAFFWGPNRLRAQVGRFAPVLLDVIGAIALAGLVWMLWSTDQYRDADSLYRGGFARVALVTVVVIAVAVHPAAHLSKVLGCRPLRWIGLRSYGLYLWHWPVYQLTRPGLDIALTGVPLLAFRLAITFGLAELSYRFVEVPIRKGALGRHWKQWRAQPAAQRRINGLGGTIGAAAMVGCLALLVVTVARAQPVVPEYLQVTSTADGVLPPGPDQLPPPNDATESAAAAEQPVGTNGFSVPAIAERLRPGSATTTPTTVTPGDAPTSTEAPPPTTVAPSTGITAPDGVLNITAIGDSVMLGAAPNLTSGLNGETFVDAAVGRQVSVGIGILQAWRDSGRLGDVVVVHLGNNGTFTPEQFQQMQEILAGVPKVVFLTVKVPRMWEEGVNQTLTAGVSGMPNAVLLDWRAASIDRPELFYDDGMHLRPEGAAFYTELVNASL
jgi:peptidoglycan/LPS O-acetylase OafA/YrhL